VGKTTRLTGVSIYIGPTSVRVTKVTKLFKRTSSLLLRKFSITTRTMHDVIETTSMAMTAPKAVRKFGVHRRMSTSNVDRESSSDHQKSGELEQRRGRSKTFSHSTKKMLDRTNSWAERCFVAKFSTPCRHLTENRLLCLKSYHVTRYSLSGVIVVKNISYEKRVFVRFSLNDWKSFGDIEARFLNADHANGEDVFQFRLDFPFRLPLGTRLEIALAYETADGEIFWDNNDQDNYVFQYSFLP